MKKVLLRQTIDGVGKAGQIISVKDGFARNYLLPKNLACEATDANMKKIEQEKVKTEQTRATEKKKAEELASKLTGKSVTITAEAHDEELYGSVTALDITKALEGEQIVIDKNAVALETPIKKLGIYEVELALHPDVKTKIKIWVVAK